MVSKGHSLILNCAPFKVVRTAVGLCSAGARLHEGPGSLLGNAAEHTSLGAG